MCMYQLWKTAGNASLPLFFSEHMKTDKKEKTKKKRKSNVQYKGLQPASGAASRIQPMI